MKKIFTLLTAILLSASMAMQAQLLSAVNDTPEGGSIPPEANLIGGRRNTPPSVTWNLAWDYADQGNSVMNTNGYSYRGALNGVKCYRYQWDSDLQIYFCFSDNSATWTSPISGATCVMPARGTYTVSTTFGNMRIGAYNTAWDGNATQSRYVESGTSYHFTSGTWYVEEGVDGPCMWSTDCYLRNAGTNKLIIGDPAVYKNVTVQSESTTKGTVSKSMKSGYVYTTNFTDWKEGSTYTITATPKSGYRFVCWKKNGTQISTDAVTDVVIDGNATYTAYFESNSAPQYTITVQADNDDYCTVSGGGTYYAGTNVTISSASKNPHLYIFDQFMLEGEDEDQGESSFNITVTGDATYTAYYRLANAGNITATAAHGTVSGTGYYAGGTEVTLGVTADDGYVFTQWSDGNQDNPRTVYVDGNKNYTAQFVQGVNINVEMGRLGVYDNSNNATMNDGSGNNSWFHIIGKSGDYEVRFETNGSRAFSSGNVYSTSDVDQSNSWIKRNGVNVPLNFSDISATATLNRTYGGKYGIYDISIRMVGTDGTVYLTTGQCVRAIYFDTADDYAFPKMDYNFGAPSFMSSIPEDYGPNSYTYTADGDGKWLYLKQSISGVDYYLRLCFKVAGNSIPTGTYHLNATGSGIPVGTAIPTILYDMSTTGNNWPNEVNGSCVFVWEQTGDENAYWWFLQYGTINVVNTNGVYYVEVDAINSFAEPVRFTMGTPPVTNHTVSITAPTNGTITVSYNDGGAQSFTSGSRDIAENTVLTITAEGATGYHFDSWTNDGAANVTVNNDKTIGATFAANAYTVTFNKNGGTGDDMTAQDFTYGTAQNLTVNAYTAPENKHFMGWATTAEGDVAYADGAEVNNLTATQNGEVELFAKWAYNTYTVVFNKNNEDATGTMANQAFTYGTAQNLTTNGFTLSGHDFAGWATEENGAVVYTNGEEVNNLTSVHEGTVNLYAKWIEIFVLSDSYNAGNAYYETLADKAGQTMNVRYERTFPAREWAAFSLPFGYSFQKEGNNTFRDQVYYLISAEYEVEGGKAYLTLNCMPNTLGIVANKPYVLIPNETIVNPVFNNVKMKAQALNYYSVPCTNIGVDNPVETVEFRNTLTRMQFANNDHRQIYLVGSKLRYPNNGTSIRAFRGYFYMQEGTIQHIQPRLRNAETGEIIEAEEETNTTVETKKYIENGILVIERAGMKYDAQGHIIK